MAKLSNNRFSKLIKPYYIEVIFSKVFYKVESECYFSTIYLTKSGK